MMRVRRFDRGKEVVIGEEGNITTSLSLSLFFSFLCFQDHFVRISDVADLDTFTDPTLTLVQVPNRRR